MTHRTVTAKRSGPRLGFIGDTISELKKVTWLKGREIRYLTFLVLVVAITMGMILGALDYGFVHLVDELFLGR